MPKYSEIIFIFRKVLKMTTAGPILFGMPEIFESGKGIEMCILIWE